MRNCSKCGCPLDEGEECVCKTIAVPPLRDRLAISSHPNCRAASVLIERLDSALERVRDLADDLDARCRGIWDNPNSKAYDLGKAAAWTSTASQLRAAMEGEVDG